jgi:hypothetical protein
MVDAPLFTYSLAHDSGPVLAPADRCTLVWRNRLSKAQPSDNVIEVVTKDALAEFLGYLHGQSAQIVQIANVREMTPASFRQPSDDDFRKPYAWRAAAVPVRRCWPRAPR